MVPNNGVLAGIAIFRAGFPDWQPHPEFKGGFNTICVTAVAKARNDKAAARRAMGVVKLDEEEYRLRHTLAFSRSGICGRIKEQRENKIGSVLAWLLSYTAPRNCHIKGTVTSG